MIELLCVLTTWRLSSLLVNEGGPFSMFARLRYAVGVRYDAHSNCVAKGLIGLFCCLRCCSVWVGAAVALALALYRGDTWFVLVVDWLAFSAGAIITEAVVSG